MNAIIKWLFDKSEEVERYDEEDGVEVQRYFKGKLPAKMYNDLLDYLYDLPREHKDWKDGKSGCTYTVKLIDTDTEYKAYHIDYKKNKGSTQIVFKFCHMWAK
jgi:hypothetical protein